MPKFAINEEQKQLVNKYHSLMNADEYLASPDAVGANERPSVKEVLTTDNANILLPHTIQIVVKEAAEPEYIGSRLLQTVRLTAGTSVEFPIFGAIRAFEIEEGQEYPEAELDMAIYEGGTTNVKVKKHGLKIKITDEMINDSQWDVIGMHLRAAGKALGRLKEEKIFREFSRHGHVVFDNDLRTRIPEAGTTGMDFSGNFNNTLSTADLMHMVAVLLTNGFRPTDIIMHPLCIPLFAENKFIEAYTRGAFSGQGLPAVEPLIMDPSKLSAQGPALGGINVIYSHWVPFDNVTKKFDMYIVDRNNIGVLLVKEDISTEQFDDPLRDIKCLKIKERYGIGILNEGRAIAVAKNIAYARSFEAPERIYTVDLPRDVADVMNKTFN
jgi:hypothetical protein